MGNDLLLATLAIETDETPDWNRARGYVQFLMPPNEMEEALDYWLGEAPADDEGELDLAECRRQLVGLVDEVQKVVESEGDRHTYMIQAVPGWKLWVTGGDSWGDSPSEAFDLFNVFQMSGIAKFAGFS